MLVVSDRPQHGKLIYRGLSASRLIDIWVDENLETLKNMIFTELSHKLSLSVRNNTILSYLDRFERRYNRHSNWYIFNIYRRLSQILSIMDIIYPIVC